MTLSLSRNPSNSNARADIVFVRNVSIQAEIGLDSWGRPKQQMALISVRLSTSVQKAGETDNIDDTMDYRKIYKALTSLDKRKFPGPLNLAEQVCFDVLKAVDGSRIETNVVLPKGLLHSEGVAVDFVMSQVLERNGEFPVRTVENSALFVHKLGIPCVIGIGAHERPRKQPVVVDLKFESGRINPDNLLLPFDRIFQVCLASIHIYICHLPIVSQTFETSSFLTLEAFVTAMARFVLLELNTGLSKVTVSAYKPAVFAAAEGPGVEIVRTVDSFPKENVPTSPT
jgi:7,8-dihydroneopterin aldolase/epimerase/oxygenase